MYGVGDRKSPPHHDETFCCARGVQAARLRSLRRVPSCISRTGSPGPNFGLTGLALLFVPRMNFHRFEVDEYIYEYQLLNLPHAIFRRVRALASVRGVTYSAGPSTGGFSGGPVLIEKGRVVGTFLGQYDGDSLCRKGFAPTYCLPGLLGRVNE